MTRAYDVVDADGHILEPLDLWDTYMDPEFRERRPRFVIDENGKERLSVEGKLLGNPRGIGSLGSVGVEGDSDEIRPAAYCTVLGVDLPRAATGIHEGVVLLTAERARVDHAFFGDQRYALAQAPPISIARSLSLRRPVWRNGSTACS